MSTKPPSKAGAMLSAWYPLTVASDARPGNMSCCLVRGLPKRALTAQAPAAALAALLPMPLPNGKPWKHSNSQQHNEYSQQCCCCEALTAHAPAAALAALLPIPLPSDKFLKHSNCQQYYVCGACLRRLLPWQCLAFTCLMPSPECTALVNT